MTSALDKYVPAFSRALFDSDLIGARLIIAMAEFFWFVMLIWPGDTMTRSPYRLMAALMPEDYWAMVFLASCFFQTLIVITEAYHARASRYFSVFNAFMWVYVVASILMSIYPPPAAIAGEIAIAIAAMWIWLRPYFILFGMSYARSKRL
jgi:hypothetical protein